ncbi:MAG: hypothetical protein ABSG53_16865 [Thermoguttaceae bacterium]|jgi:hypothetical protein
MPIWLLEAEECPSSAGKQSTKWSGCYAGIAPGDTAALDALLPDRWLTDHLEHRLEQGEEDSREAQARRHRERIARRAATASQMMATP